MLARVRPSMFVFALLVSPLALGAETPVILHHSGRLLDANDVPVTGQKSLTIKIWDGDGASATTVWTQAYETTLSSSGVYAIALGDTTGGRPALPATTFDGGRWLSLTIDGVELLPRQRIGAVPLAGHAENASRLAGLGLTELDARYDAKYAAKTGGSFVALDPSAAQAGAIEVTGKVTAAGFKGSGAELTGVPVAALTGDLGFDRVTGSLAIDRVSGTLGFDRVTGNLPTTRLEGSLDGSRIDGVVPAVSLPLASASAPGAMSAADKQKLDGLRAAPPVLTGETRPTGVTTGQLFFNTSSKLLELYDGSAWKNVFLGTPLMQSCRGLRDAGITQSGVYDIDPDGAGASAPFKVYCDMTTDGGGWTLAVTIDGNDEDHSNVNQVGSLPIQPGQSTSKLNDAVIRSLITEPTKAQIRFTCDGTKHFIRDCSWRATKGLPDNSDKCVWFYSNESAAANTLQNNVACNIGSGALGSHCTSPSPAAHTYCSHCDNADGAGTHERKGCGHDSTGYGKVGEVWVR